ncbi:MAG TPA: ribosome assembly RNA-binding protein YhbY [Thermoanaerobaculia bacterium]
MAKLKGSQRKWLRGQAHSLRPIVQIGQKGLSEATLREVDLALDSHELIKVQAVAPKEEKQEIGRQIEKELRAQVIGLIGHILILYRRHPDPDQRRIHLPD